MVILIGLILAVLLPVGALLGLMYAIGGVGAVVFAIMTTIRKIFC